MSTSRRLLGALLGAAVFGVLAGVLKGNDAGVRGQIGNLSAPWLLVAALPALWCRNARHGAIAGLLSTVVALICFYAVTTLMLAGHLGGGGYVREFVVETGANRLYFFAGLVTGPLCGAGGAWAARRHRDAAWLLVGGVMAFEIVVVAVLQGHQLAPAPLYFRWGVDAWAPYVGESALGVGIVAAALWRRGRPRLPSR